MSPPVGIICDISMSIVGFYKIWSILGCLESFGGINWPEIAWNNEKLAQNPWNLALAHFSWLRSLPVGIVCDVSLSILWTYNIWPIFGCVEFSRRKCCQELLQIMKNKLKTYLKSKLLLASVHPSPFTWYDLWHIENHICGQYVWGFGVFWRLSDSRFQSSRKKKIG